MNRSANHRDGRHRTRRATSRRRNAQLRLTPRADGLEDRTMLSISILDLSVLEGNGGPVQVAGSFEESTETDYYQLQGAAGRTIYFDSTTPANTGGSWSLYRADGAYVGGTGITGDMRLTLPAAGNYTLAVAGPGGSPALTDYSFRLFDVTAPDVALSSNFNQVESGTLAAGQSRTITYTAPAGQSLFFDNLDDYDSDNVAISLTTPSGDSIFNAYSYTYDSTAPILLPDAGTYQLRITGTGDYKFKLSTLPAAATALTIGATVQGTVPDNETDLFSFTGAVGQRLSYDSLEASANVDVYLVDPTGDVVSLNQSANADRGVFTLTEPGRYLLAIRGRVVGAASYKFRLVDAAQAPTVAYTPGAVQAGTIDPTETDFYRFTAAAGQRVYFDSLSTSASGGSYWAIYGPNDQALASNYIYGSGSGDGEFVAPAAGTYILAVAGQGGSAAVDYSFRISETTDSSAALTLGALTSGTLAAAGEQDAYTFAGSVGQRLVFDGRSGAGIYASLYGPTGAQLFSRQVTDDNAPVTLTQSGTYRLVLDGSGAATGAYQFRLVDAAQAPTAAYTPGTDRSGTLDPTTETDLYRFTAAAGQRVYFDSLSTSASGGSYWAIYGPNDQALASNYIYGSGSGDGEFVAPAAGTYILAVAGQGGSAAVDYSFRISETTDSSAALTLGALTSGTLAAAGEQDAYTFAGSVGQRLVFDGRSGAGIYASLYGPTGAQLFSRQVTDDNAPVTLTQSGTYRLVLDGSGAATGAYQFRLVDAAQAPTAAYTPGTDRSGTLDPTTETDLYRFTAAAGQRVYFDSLSASASGGSYWAIYGPNDQALASNYIYGSGSGDGEFVAPAAGTYILAVAGQGGSAAVDYSFRISETTDSATALTLGALTSGTLAAAGEQDAYTFAGSVGQRVYLDGRSGAGIYAALYGPTGAQLFNQVLTDDARLALLTQSGTYRLVVDGSGSAAGAYQFRLVDAAQAPTVAYTPGAVQSGTLDPTTETDLYRFTATAGQKIAFDALTNTGDTYGVYWSLYGPAGQLLAENYLYGNGSGDGEVLAPADGSYILAIRGLGSATAVSYSFRTNVTGGAGTTDNFGVLRTGTITAGEVETYTFSATAGLLVYFDSQDRDGAPLVATLADPDGNNVATAYVSSGDYGPYRLPKSGTYTLKIQGQYATATGSYRFRLLNLGADATALTLGQSVAGSLPSYETDFYRFTGSPGQRLVFDSLSAANSSIGYLLYNPDGSAATSNNAIYDSAPFTLTQAGSYFLRFETSSASVEDYSFRLIDVAQSPAQAYTLDTTKSDTLDPGLSADLYRFDGTAGQRVYVDILSPASDFTGRWYLYDPSNAQIAGNYLNASYDGEVTLGATGRYVLAFLGGAASGTLDYSFRVTTPEDSTAAMTLGSAVSGTIAEVGERDAYTFAGSVGQRLIYDGLSGDPSLQPHLYSPSGADLTSFLYYPYGVSQDTAPFTLTEAGTYRLVVDGSAAATGDYSFRLIDVAQSPAQSYALDTTRSATLSPGTSAGVYTFDGTAGQRVFVDILSPASDFTSRWYLYDPNNAQVAGTYLNAGYDGEVTLGATGKYVLSFLGASTAGDLDYSFRVTTPEDSTAAVTLGSAVSGTIAEVGERDAYTFAGSVGQRLLYDGLSGDPSLQPHLYSPSGADLTSFLYYPYGVNQDSSPFTLTEAGTYRLVVDGSAAATGDYSFRLIDVAQSPAQSYALDTTRSATLSPGTSAGVYTFDGTAGQRVFVDILSPASDFTSRWYLYDPNNAQVAGTYLNAGYDGEVTLGATGRYVLAFLGASTAGDLDYSFRVVTPDTTSTPLTLGERTTGALDEPGEIDEYTFTATAGRKIAVDLLSNLGGSLRATLYDPLGNQVFSTNYQDDVNSLTLIRSGTYRLAIDGSGETTGNYKFRVIDLATAPTPAIGTDKAVVTVVLSAPSTSREYVYYSTADSTAQAGSDYVTRADYVYFAPGLTTRVIVIPIVGDTTVEPDETFTVNLQNPSSGQAITDAQSVVTILNDDTSVTMAIDDVVKAEGSGGGTTAFTFTVTLSSATTQAVTVAYQTADGTAAAGSDYTAASGTLTFAPGETTKTITVQVAADTDGEAAETFFVNLSSPTNALIADAQGQATILNDDARVSIGDVTVTEGDSGTVQAVFTVTLSSASSLTTSVNYATADGSAASPSDYTSASGTITFAPGETSKTISVAVLGDANVEGDETFFVNLTNAVNAAFTDSQGQATIRNDDAAFYIGDAAVSEGDSGTKQLAFTVSIPYATTKTVSVKYATADGTATAGSDYNAASGTLTFAPGETSKVVNVTIRGDATPEANETFLVNLTDPTNATLGDAQAVGTIYNDDTTISVADASVAEGDSGTTTLNVTVSLSVASSATVTVAYATANGTATAGSDYTAASGTLTFAPGETSKTIAIAVAGDTTDEADETIVVNLSNPTSAILADSQGVATIRNDDGSLGVVGGTVAEGDSGTRTIGFVVSLAHATARTVSVKYATADGTATAGSDYNAASGTLTFAPGETSKTVNVTIRGDVLVEDDETFYLDLSTPSNAVLATARGTATISNDDAAPALSIGSRSVGEGQSGSTPAVFTVTLSTASSKTVTVAYATANGTATAGSDYNAASGTLTFAPGETSKAVSIDVLGDAIDEADETFTVTLSAATNATIADAQGLGTILDDDSPPTISIGDRRVTEGNSGSTAAEFIVSLSAASGKTITVAYATSNGTATAGSDYTAASGTLTFAPGETSKAISVAVLGDTLAEADEAYSVTLSTPTNATLADASATGTILDDDDVPTLSVGDVTVAEGDSGSVQAVFTVSLSAASGETITVGYATANGTATAGSDYTAASGTLTFAPGETSKTINVDVLGDLLPEGLETFLVQLSSPTNATLADAQGEGTIVDNDGAPSLLVADASVVEGDGGASEAAFQVTLTRASGQAVTVKYATASGTATSGSDFTAASGTLTFAPGETSKTVRVSVLGDVTVEPDESFTLTLSDPSNASLGDPEATGLIRNDDAALTISDGTITEGDSGSASVSFTVSIAQPSALPVTVSYATADGTATAGSDYTAASGTLTFAPGETSKTISVAVLGDATDEADETFAVNLSAPTNATLADASATGTIADDDAAPSISIDGVRVTEGDSGTVDAVFTVSLSSASGKSIRVDYATAGGTATAGVDFEPASGTLTFAPGETSRTITVRVKGDVAIEADETFTVDLAAPTNASLAVASAAGVILNDDHAADPAPTVASFVVDDGSAQRSMVRSLTVTFSEEVTVGPGAFELRTPGGVAVPVTVDTRVEAGRTVAVLTFAGGGIVGGSLADGDYRLTIVAARIADSSGQHLDGNRDGTANDAAIFDFYRFFGDMDGDRDVDSADYGALYKARNLQGYLSALDYDSDGDVDAADVAQFLARYRRVLPR
ncbi:Calx-beta domain protein [Aquisphaera giovannonii]|uniref:Calx-beta domain protein n=1 Tax=Aquisphaera giovannonii TaxID=406548 RepID=A0A5B9W4L0_9BACT|nr:Calx-beta domain-containing protein [Aquisphaera giovannonii]QEH35011.1 Calx-beta domain protein [Aquisphaera giovannonii]